jgi:hypothetical protein
MSTVYDWVTVAIFAGLIVLFLQRSSTPGEPQDSLWQYLVASVGCALTNYFGNQAVKHEGGVDYLDHGIAIAVLIGTLAFIWIVLKPLSGLGPKK